MPKVILKSLDRATINGFMDSFYDSFLASSDEVRKMFEGVDMAVQKRMMHKSMSIFALSVNNLDTFFELNEVKELIEKHRNQLKVSDELFYLWKTCFLETIEQYDDEFDDALKEKWNTLLDLFIERCISHPQHELSLN